jgi:hypothetical protein
MTEQPMNGTALWILEPRDDLTDEDNPWKPWFDRCFGLVVEAEDEQSARSLAHENCVATDRTILKDRCVFLDPKYTTCVNLTPSGHKRVVMTNFQLA